MNVRPGDRIRYRPAGELEREGEVLKTDEDHYPIRVTDELAPTSGDWLIREDEVVALVDHGYRVDAGPKTL